jgi:hypothetical protein
MKTNKTFLAISVLLVSIGAINTASAGWCGNNVVAANQGNPAYAGNVTCSSPTYGTPADCMTSQVANAAALCVQPAADLVAANPNDQAAIANYTNLSMYFFGSYDMNSVRTSVIPASLPLTPAPNVNVRGACLAQHYGNNAQICAAAHTAILNPNFVVPTAAVPVSQQTADQCYTEAYNNANALFNLQIQNLKTGQAGQNPNNIAYVVGMTAINANQKALQTNCNGSKRSVAGCTQFVQLACTGVQKSKYTYCNNSTMSTFIVNCQ